MTIRKKAMKNIFQTDATISQRPTITPNKWLQRRNSGLCTPDCGIFLLIRRHFNATEVIVFRKIPLSKYQDKSVENKT